MVLSKILILLAMLNIWDWELLSNPSNERLSQWREATRKNYYNLYGICLSKEDLDICYQKLLNDNLFLAIARLQEFWLYWVWVIKYRLFGFWYQDLNEDKRHWMHGRGRVRLLLNDQNKIDTYNCVNLYASWSIPSSFYDLELQVGGEDDGIMLSFGCGLFSVCLGIENIIPRRWARKISKFDHERVTGIRLHHGSIWFAFWRDEYGYADNWKGIHRYFDVVEFLLGKQEYIEGPATTTQASLNLPEASYLIDLKFYEATWKRSRNPFPLKQNRCRLIPAQPISIPGKGENDYDLDEDAIYEMTISASTVEEAIAYLHEDILKTRKRYGGEQWQPEAEIEK